MPTNWCLWILDHLVSQHLTITQCMYNKVHCPSNTHHICEQLLLLLFIVKNYYLKQNYADTVLGED